MSTWQPGDIGWFVPYDKRERQYEVIVKSVTRKWVTVDRGMRFDRETGRVDGARHPSPGRVWKSKDHALSHQRATAILILIYNNVLRLRDVPEANARQAAALLGIDVAEDA
jgi:hypothetical protein